MRDYFISYNKTDGSFAEWIAWVLEDAGYSVILQAWDFRPGTNFVLEMHAASQSASRTIAVLSPDFLASQYTQAEWAAAFAKDPTSTRGSLLPVKVRECEPVGLLGTIVHIDLVGLPEDIARSRLLAGLAATRSKPGVSPRYPSSGVSAVFPLPGPAARPACIRLIHLSGPLFGDRNQAALKSVALEVLALAARPPSTQIVGGLLVSGDLTQSATQTEFGTAQAALSDLCNRLEVSTDDACYFAPGNHDVSWPMIGPADAGILGTLTGQEQVARILSHAPSMYLLSARLANFYSFTEVFLGKARAWRPDRPWKVEVKVVAGLRFAFLQLNTAWTLGPDSSQPLIGEFQVREALSEAGDVDYRIWVFHHPLSALAPDEARRISSVLGSVGAVNLVFTNADHDASINLSTPPTSSGFQATCLPSFGHHELYATCGIVDIAPNSGNITIRNLQFDRDSLRWRDAPTPLTAGGRVPQEDRRPSAPQPEAPAQGSTASRRKGVSPRTPKQSALTFASFDTRPVVRSASPAQMRNIFGERRPVLLLTAVEIELRAVLSVLKPIHPKRNVLRAHAGQETYYIGTFGAEPVVLTMCGMGSIGRDSVILAAHQAITEVNPIAIVMIGIAFGSDSVRQSIGDVLVASQVVSYEQQRIGRTNEVHRGPIAQTGPILLNRFRQALDWKFLLPDGRQSRALVGPILSGEKLIDSQEYRDSLFDAFPQAIGGEMEGAGLQAVAARTNLEWILVKGICDWADGRKMDNYQTLAARAAVSLVHHVLAEPGTLEAARA